MSRRQLFPPPPQTPPSLPVLLPSLPAPPLPPWHFTLHIYRDLGVPAACLSGLLQSLSRAFPFAAVSHSALTVSQHGALTAACWDADREQLQGIRVLDVLEQQWSLQTEREEREAEDAVQAAEQPEAPQRPAAAAAAAAQAPMQRRHRERQPQPQSWPQQPRFIYQPATQQREAEEKEEEKREERRAANGEAEAETAASLAKRQRRDGAALTVRTSRGLWQRDASRCKTLREGMFTECGLQRERAEEKECREPGRQQEEPRGGRASAQLQWSSQSSDGGPVDGDDAEQLLPQRQQQHWQLRSSAGRERKRPRANNGLAARVGQRASPPAASQARAGFISVTTISSSSTGVCDLFTASLQQQRQQSPSSSFCPSSAVFCSYSRLCSLSHPNLLMQPRGPAASSSTCSSVGASTLRFSLFLTSLDCFVPGLTFVFGVARLCRCALVSTARLTLPTAAASAAFLSKECVHELGHLFGLHHCSLPCVMTYSTSVEEAIRKDGQLCARCEWKVDWMRRGILVRDMQPAAAVEQMRRYQHQQLHSIRQRERDRPSQQWPQQDADDEDEQEQEQD